MKKVVTVDIRLTESEDILLKRATKKAGLALSAVKEHRILKKSVDARHKNDIKIQYKVELSTEKQEKSPKIYEKLESEKFVVVVGAGPAGLFCALDLVRHGVKVLVIERGESVENRQKTVEKFFLGDNLNENSNVQFGEGGAGAFSDGKLNTSISSEKIISVLEDLVFFGAPLDIQYLAKPHIGSDNLPKVVKNIRENIISLGGKFMFSTLVTDLVVEGGTVRGVKTSSGDEILADAVVLAIGHSARETFEMLYKKGVSMEQKEFAVGFRIEQKQEIIDIDRYGKFYKNEKLKPAEYKLVSHKSDRAVFTFCMCPGGVVVPASSYEGGLCVNGMSNYLRDGENANSAVICQVKKSDFESSNPLAGVYFQQSIERKAYLLGGGNFTAPVSLAKDFLEGTSSTTLNGVLPTYRRGFRLTSLENIYQKPITESLKIALFDMDQKINGFASNGAVLTGVETRTSSPIRILRGENFQSLNVKNLYPCGEGCGYAGGIMSASCDGLKVSSAIFSMLKSK